MAAWENSEVSDVMTNHLVDSQAGLGFVSPWGQIMGIGPSMGMPLLVLGWAVVMSPA